MQIILNPGGGVFSEVFIENPTAQQTEQPRELAKGRQPKIFLPAQIKDIAVCVCLYTFIM